MKHLQYRHVMVFHGHIIEISATREFDMEKVFDCGVKVRD